jgi:murein DD-endopeptidase MepM/ murein hydrolase activator NlpD
MREKAARPVQEQREMIFRMHRCLRYLRLGRVTQTAALALLTGAIGWSGYATAIYFTHNKTVSARNAEIVSLETRNEKLEGDLARLRNSIAIQEKSLTATQKSTDDLLADNEKLQFRVAGLEKRLTEEVEARATDEIARSGLINRLNELVRELAAAEQDKKSLQGEREALGAEVASLSGLLESIEEAQGNIVARLAEQASESGDALKRTLSIAGLDVDRILDRLSRSDGGAAVGGPLLPIDESLGAQLVHKILTVDRRIDDFERLQNLMQRLPLIAPLDEYRITSGYGRRVDPFTKRLALHSGIDLASRRKASVMATAPGKVTYVGWKGGYGKIVEVDHGLGIRTRYAHLSNIYVKRGQKLEFREKVGQVGSTGRSTGEHLHYEVVVDSRSQNPADFIKAGQYIFKK